MNYVEKRRVLNALDEVYALVDVPADLILRSKGDYMRELKEMDPSIKEMDSAIPLELQKKLNALDQTCSEYVYAYYKSGREGLLNVVSRWAILTNNQ